MLIAGVPAYNPFPVSPADGHGPRITIGRTVWRRETWHIPAEQGQTRTEIAASWARDRGMPRRVFALSPGETKPTYIDFDGPVLTPDHVPPVPPRRRRPPRPAGPVYRDAPRARRLLADRRARPALHQRAAPSRGRPGTQGTQKVRVTEAGHTAMHPAL
jgi:hypothetical protein